MASLIARLARPNQAQAAASALRYNAVRQKLFVSQEAATGLRAFASAQAQEAPTNIFRNVLFLGVGVGGLYSYVMFNSGLTMPQQQSLATPNKPVSNVGDYGAVRKAIANLMDVDGYDDGSYGPVLVRLAWHAAGTYDKTSGTGGSNGATMRFSPECEHAANAGLKVARDLLEPVKAAFPWISYADLWTLAGCVAIEEMGGPHIAWRAGRSDAPAADACPPDGRLPDAAQGASHVRDVFGRMGFTDQEAVALIGAHTLGRCHTDRSGYSGPWTNAPTTFSNLYFQDLVNRKWVKKNWNGPLQYEDKESRALMMLPADMALLWDKKLKQYVQLYAKDEAAFFRDFATAFQKLMELGVKFPEGTQAA